MAAEWTVHKGAIKEKYITSDRKPTLRELAREYGGNKDTIGRWVKEEDWDSQRESHIAKIETKVLQGDIQIKTKRAKKIARAADILLDGIIAGMGEGTPISPTAAKNYAEAINGIKNIHMVRSEEDIEEQRARIDKLRKEAAKEDRSSTITVTMEGDIGSYGK